MMRLTLTLAAILSIQLCLAHDENKKIGEKEYDSVSYDIFNNKVDGFLPFDVPFTFEGEVPNSVTKIEIFYIQRSLIQKEITYSGSGNTNTQFDVRDAMEFSCTEQDSLKVKICLQESYKDLPKDKYWKYSKWERNNLLLDLKKEDKNKFTIYIDPLKPNRSYEFYTRITYDVSSEGLDTLVIDLFTKDLIQFSQDKKIKFEGDPEKFMLDHSGNLEEASFYELVNLGLANRSAHKYNKDTELDLGVESVNSVSSLGLFSEDIYDRIAVKLQELLNSKYELEFDVQYLKSLLESAISKNNLLEYTKKYNESEKTKDKVLSNAESARFHFDPLLYERMVLNNWTSPLSKFEELRPIMVAEDVRIDYNLGRYKIGSNEPRLPRLQDSKTKNEYSVLLGNITFLQGKIAALKDEIKNMFWTTDIVANFDPDLSESHKKALVDKKLKDREAILAEYKSKDIEYRLLINAQIQECDRYISNLRIAIYSEILNLGNQKEELNQFWVSATKSFNLKLSKESDISGAFQNSTTNDFMTRAEYYISADIGMAAMMFKNVNGTNNRFGSIQPYLGVNFNLLPINRQAHYSAFSRQLNGRSRIGTILRGTSVMIGLTQRNVGLDIYGVNSHIKGVWDAPNVMLLSGLGIRISDYLRLSCGTSWFRYKQNYSPISNEEYRLGMNFFVSLSLDWDVRSFVSNVTSKLFTGVQNIGG